MLHSGRYGLILAPFSLFGLVGCNHVGEKMVIQKRLAVIRIVSLKIKQRQLKTSRSMSLLNNKKYYMVRRINEHGMNMA